MGAEPGVGVAGKGARGVDRVVGQDQQVEVVPQLLHHVDAVRVEQPLQLDAVPQGHEPGRRPVGVDPGAQPTPRLQRSQGVAVLGTQTLEALALG